MANSHEVCSYEIGQTLKYIFGEKGQEDLEIRINEFEQDLASILQTAKEKGISPNEAIKMAKGNMILKIKQVALHKVKNNEAKIRLEKHMAQFEDKKLGLETLLTNIEGKSYKSDGASIYARREAIQNIVNKMLVEGIFDMDKNLKMAASGKYDLEVKKVLAGEYTEAELGKLDPFIIAYAKSARKAQDMLHQLKTDAGMSMGYIENRISGQRHSAQGMLKMGEKPWKKLARDSFDWQRMGYRTEADINKQLDTMWKEITSKDGSDFFRVTSDVREVVFNSSLKKMERKRSVHFLDAEASHKYNKQVNGETSLLSELMMEIERDSGKIAAAQKLGPNYTARWKQLTEGIDTSTGLNPLDMKFENAVFGSMGSGNSVGAKIIGGLNKVSDVTKLPDAIISTVTDLGFGPMVMSAQTGKNLFESVTDSILSILDTMGNDRKKSAMQLGVMINDTIDSTFTGRMEEDGNRTTWLNKWHSRFMQATMLPAQSHLFRVSSSIQYATELHGIKDIEFDKLDKAYINRFQKYGIDKKKWDIIRVHAIDQMPDGRKVLNPSKITELDPKLFEGQLTADKRITRNEIAMSLNGMLVELSESYSPTPNSSTMAWRDRVHPDTPAGMAARGMGKYKAFILSMPKTINAIKGDDGYNTASVTRLANAVIMATVLKYSSDYLKSIVKGKEPPDAKDPKVWAKAAISSGAGAIYADFFAQDFGSSPFSSAAEFVLGPGIDTGQDVYSAASGTVQAIGNTLVGDEKGAKKQRKRAVRDLEKITPKLPFVGNKINKTIYDNIHLLLNTGAKR